MSAVSIEPADSLVLICPLRPTIINSGVAVDSGGKQTALVHKYTSLCHHTRLIFTDKFNQEYEQ